LQVKLIILGVVSQTQRELTLKESDQNLSLLEILRINSIPIASSCDGEGICKKCLVNDELISCQIKVKDFLARGENTIKISYW
tara:strand:- start:11404 stop:11652 length:249 start_codon:yes stop_codon:yes gene_type:complete